MITVSFYGWDFDIEDAVKWAIDNCYSFEDYMIVELSPEEKTERDCWFRFDVRFATEADALMFKLRWL